MSSSLKLRREMIWLFTNLQLAISSCKHERCKINHDTCCSIMLQLLANDSFNHSSVNAGDVSYQNERWNIIDYTGAHSDVVIMMCIILHLWSMAAVVVHEAADTNRLVEYVFSRALSGSLWPQERLLCWHLYRLLLLLNDCCWNNIKSR
jgi:hypothetical protein